MKIVTVISIDCRCFDFVKFDHVTGRQEDMGNPFLLG